MSHRANGRGPVRQLEDTVEHAYGQGFPADRTDIPRNNAFPGVEHHGTFTMPVQMIFALFGIEFNGSPEFGSRKLPLEGSENTGVILSSMKNIGLAAQIGSGVSVRIGDQSIIVQTAP